jgi:hypothetical protein
MSTITTKELINPPQEVTVALANLKHACSGWQPTELQLPPKPPPSSGPIDWHPPANEAMTCQFVKDPMGMVLHQIYMIDGMALILLIIFFGAAFMMGLHRLPSALRRLQKRYLLRAG